MFVAHGHVRVQGVVLEHHRDVAVAGWHVVDDPVTDRQLAAGDLLQSGDHAECRRLAAPRRADEHHELAVLDDEIERVDRQRAVTLVLLGDGAEAHY